MLENLFISSTLSLAVPKLLDKLIAVIIGILILILDLF